MDIYMKLIQQITYRIDKRKKKFQRFINCKQLYIWKNIRKFNIKIKIKLILIHKKILIDLINISYTTNTISKKKKKLKQ